MEVRILGTIDIRDEAGPVGLVRKPLAVLDVLLSYANEPVGSERLTRESWVEDAPASAVKRVHVHVPWPRRTWGDTGVVVTSVAGHRLRAGPDEVDARFERLVDEGRAAAWSPQAR